VLLPVVLEFNKEVSADRLRHLAGQFNCKDPIEHVRELNRRIGIAPRLRDHGIPEDALPALADKAIQDGCHQLNPRACTREDLLELYRRAW
jgi:alcohol dehydrogenase class IV